MNRARRELLKRAKDNLNAAAIQVSKALDEEEDCLGNVPDSLQYSERYEKMENAVEALNDASESIDAAIENIDAAIDRINDAILAR